MFCLLDNYNLMPRKIFRTFLSFSFFQTLRQISILFVSNLAIQSLGIISLPIYTWYLSEAEYGITNACTSYLTVLNVLLTLNFNGAIARYYYENKDDYRAFIGTSLSLATLSFLILGGIFYIFKENISAFVNIPAYLLIWLLVSTYTILLWSIFEQLSLARSEVKRFAIFQIIFQYLKFAGSLLGIIWFSTNGVYGKIVGETLFAILILLSLLPYLRKHIRFGISKAHVLYIVRFCMPLLPLTLSGYILNSFDQWFINARIGNDIAGIYSFAYKMGFLMSGFINSLVYGSNPLFYQFMNEGKHEAMYAQTKSLLKLLFLGAISLMLFAETIGYLLAAKKTFTNALILVPPVVVAYFFSGAQILYARLIYFSKKNTWLMGIVFSGGIINILLNQWLIPIWGYEIAAYITLFSYFLMFLCSVFVTYFILDLPSLPLAKISLYAFFLLLLMIALYFAPLLHLSFSENLLIRFFLWGSIGIILYWKQWKLVLQKK